MLNSILNVRNYPHFHVDAICKKNFIFPELLSLSRFDYCSAEEKGSFLSFPFLIYLLSNLFFGLISSVFLFFFLAVKKTKNNEKIIFHVHDPIIGSILFLTPSFLLHSAGYIGHFHSEYYKRLQIMLPKTFLSTFTLYIFRFFEKLYAIRAQNLIAVNENIFQYLLKFNINDEKIHKIPIFFKIKSFCNGLKIPDVLSVINLRSDDLIITYVGRLSKEKNVKTLIKSISNLEGCMKQKIVLLIVGDGDQISQIKKMCERVDYRVFCLGHRNDVNSILNISKVFVLPSFTEGFPYSLLEAMALGKVIIASDIPPIKTIISDGKEALLFDPNCSGQLSKALEIVFQNPKLRKQLSKNANNMALKYDIDIIYPRILNVYRNLCGK